VRASVVELVSITRDVELTGVVRARTQSDLAFRVGGKIATRLVDLGDHVVAGQTLATLDGAQQQADLQTARAALESAQASFAQAKTAFDRQKDLLAGGFGTRAAYDTAQVAYLSADSAVKAGEANVALVQDALSYTELKSDAAGLITQRLGEVGQVVAPAQTIFTLAQDGDRDAVFNVYEALLSGDAKDVRVDVSLVSDPKVTTTASVREVAPSVDPVSGTVQVKLALASPPPAMTLGASVVGRGRFQPHQVFRLPWEALTREGDAPTVYVIDAASGAVAARSVTVESFVTGFVLLSGGLQPGEKVVTAGVQLLRPGMHVTATDAAP
jgi:membrane fusion protein, multidrug efflux system